MFPGEQAEDAIVADVANPNGKEGETRGGTMGVEGGVGDREQEDQHGGKFTMKSLLWHGGSVWDAWFSCASNQVNNIPSYAHGSRCQDARPLELSNKSMAFAGGAGAADAAVLVLADGHGLRRAAPGVLRPHGQLDRLPHQRRVPHPQGEARRQLQEPRHPGRHSPRSLLHLRYCPVSSLSTASRRAHGFRAALRMLLFRRWRGTGNWIRPPES
jgi:hypothetical protein